MNRPIYGTFLALALAGCGSGADSAGSGGNVGFGGAQDIGAFRGILNDGGIPGAATLDANGFFSEHYIELPPADCGQPLCLHGMLSVGHEWRTGAYQAALMVALNTPLDASELTRKPLNLAVVVDTSGSMAQDRRLALVIDGLHLLVDRLEDDDRLTLITYDSEVTVVAEFGALDRPALHAAIDRLFPAGATNLHGGLEAGLGAIASAYDVQRQNRVILLSDGLATAGVTEGETIIEMATAYIEDGIGLTTIGVGLDFDVALMRGLAERGAGNFYFLESPAAVSEVFTEELDVMVEPIALGLELDVANSADYTLGEVHGTRLWRGSSDGGQIYIPAAFLASRTSASGVDGRRGGGSAIVLALDPRADAPADAQVAQLRLRYRLPDSTELIEQTATVANPLAAGVAPAEPYLSFAEMSKAYAVYNVFLGLRAAAQAAQYDYHCADQELARLDADARAWNQRREDPEIAEDLDLIAQFRANLGNVGAAAALCGQWDYDDAYYDDEQYGCSAAGELGARGSACLVLLALGAALRRRRPA